MGETKEIPSKEGFFFKGWMRNNMNPNPNVTPGPGFQSRAYWREFSVHLTTVPYMMFSRPF